MKKVRNIIFYFIALIFNYQFLASQSSTELFNWRVYSSMVNILSGCTDTRGNVWCATIGGVLSFKPQNNTFEIFNSLNGLYSIEANYITINNFSKEIYVGTFDGVLSIYNPSTLRWENYLEIQKSNFSKKQIHHILFNDSIAYISGDFGLTTFDTRKRVFLKTPSRLGNFPSGTSSRYSVVYGNWLWVATELGIARINLGRNISNPDYWENFVETNGLADPKILFLAIENDTLYAFASTKIYKFDGEKFITYFELNSYETINCVQTFNGKIYFSTPFFIRDINYQLIYFFNETPLNEKINSFTIIDENTFVLFLNNGGLVIKNTKSKELKRYYPNSPISNQFRHFAIDSRGGFWSATNADPVGEGIMHFSNNRWINFTIQTFPQIETNYYMKVTCLADTVFCSSAGRGLLKIFPSADTFRFQRFDHTNSLLTGIGNDPGWVIVQQTEYEKSKELLWMINYSVGKNGFLLVAKDRSDKFYGFIPLSDRKFHNLLIDGYGTKWISSLDGVGFYYFNEGVSLADTSDDIWGNLSRMVSLPTTQITSLAYDHFGYIWCGTGSGLFLLLNPNAILAKSAPVVKKLKLLADYYINCIYIDPLNNKWIATNNGVFVISPDGSDILANYTTENSLLPSNEVLYITSNPNTGDFYFGTPKGLAIATTMIVQPSPDYQIKVSPQPFIVPKDNLLLIDGLAMDSEIKILTINGELIRTLNTQSKKTFWDGKDYTGSYVQSGIYLLVAKSLTTKQSAVYKIAVINK